MKMKMLVKKIGKDEKGISALEYAAIAAVVLGGIAVAAPQLTGGILQLFTGVNVFGTNTGAAIAGAAIP